MTTAKNITKSNITKVLRSAIDEYVPGLAAEVGTAQAGPLPCGCLRGAIDRATGEIKCLPGAGSSNRCMPIDLAVMTSVPPLNLGANRHLVWATHEGRRFLVALVAGSRVILPSQNVSLGAGAPIAELKRQAYRAVLPHLGMTERPAGVWRRPDGTRLDGNDWAEAVFEGTGNPADVEAWKKMQD